MTREERRHKIEIAIREEQNAFTLNGAIVVTGQTSAAVRILGLFDDWARELEAGRSEVDASIIDELQREIADERDRNRLAARVEQLTAQLSITRSELSAKECAIAEMTRELDDMAGDLGRAKLKGAG